jgi:putative Mg2+ transporter-C (MgtC) family protein
MAGPHFSWLELVIRLGSALVFGSVIGAERQWRQRTAGLRTYSLVAVGAALFVLLAPGTDTPHSIADAFSVDAS